LYSGWSVLQSAFVAFFPIRSLSQPFFHLSLSFTHAVPSSSSTPILHLIFVFLSCPQPVESWHSAPFSAQLTHVCCTPIQVLRFVSSVFRLSQSLGSTPPPGNLLLVLSFYSPCRSELLSLPGWFDLTCRCAPTPNQLTFLSSVKRRYTYFPDRSYDDFRGVYLVRIPPGNSMNRAHSIRRPVLCGVRPQFCSFIFRLYFPCLCSLPSVHRPPRVVLTPYPVFPSPLLTPPSVTIGHFQVSHSASPPLLPSRAFPSLPSEIHFSMI